MARFAPVVPLQIARVLQNQEVNDYLGAYHLVLAHDIIDKPKEYQEVYGEVRTRNGDNSFIILDNSIIELGKAMEIKDLLRATEILRPDCIVIPDVMGEGTATRESAVKFVRQYVQAAYELGDSANPPSLMGVLQGDDVNDVMETLAMFYALPFIDYIGIPRVLTKMHGSRMPTLMAMQRSPALAGGFDGASDLGYRSFKGFHLLGFSDDILDDVSCARVPWIGGIDSAVPIRAGSKHIEMSLDDPTWSDRTGPRGDFWEKSLGMGALEVTKRNLDKYRSWVATPELKIAA